MENNLDSLENHEEEEEQNQSFNQATLIDRNGSLLVKTIFVNVFVMVCLSLFAVHFTHRSNFA